jgi:putative SOS response-associated peptidase YedK
MCGRFTTSTPPAVLAEHFKVDALKTEDLGENYNVAPTARVYAVATTKEGERALGTFKWGLVPGWAKDPSVGSKMINARAETVSTKNAYRKAFQKKRCIIPADGFYEWQVVPGPPPAEGEQPADGARAGQGAKAAKPNKQPVFIHRVDGQPLAFAGLWETWQGAGDVEPIRTCTIITTTANETLRPVHDRMPVILPPEAWDVWLDPEQQDPEVLEKLLVPAAEDLLTYHPVSKLVNSVRNRGIELVRPIDPETGEVLGPLFAP